MNWRQQAGGQTRPFLLLDKADPRTGLRVVHLRDWSEALRWLYGSLQDPVQMAGIRRWWARLGSSPRRDDRAMLADIARAQAAGRVLFAVPEVWRPAGLANDTGKSRPKGRDRPRPPRPRERPAPPPRAPQVPEPVQPVVPPAQTKTWIEFRLLDDETQAPIANVPFHITLTDGSETTQSTDASGLIRIDGLDPGSCGIREIRAEDAPELTKVT